jgi:hypothetical protein
MDIFFSKKGHLKKIGFRKKLAVSSTQTQRIVFDGVENQRLARFMMLDNETSHTDTVSTLYPMHFVCKKGCVDALKEMLTFERISFLNLEYMNPHTKEWAFLFLTAFFQGEIYAPDYLNSGIQSLNNLNDGTCLIPRLKEAGCPMAVSFLESEPQRLNTFESLKTMSSVGEERDAAIRASLACFESELAGLSQFSLLPAEVKGIQDNQLRQEVSTYLDRVGVHLTMVYTSARTVLLSGLDAEGHSPLYYAYSYDHKEMVGYLKSMGCKLTVEDAYLLLFPSVQKNNLWCLPDLKEVLRDLNLVKDKHGNTCLHGASEEGHLPTVTYLVEVLGLNVLVINKKEKMPFNCAFDGGFPEVASYLWGKFTPEVQAIQREYYHSLSLAKASKKRYKSNDLN